MSEAPPPIGDDDLHAYVDGQLETSRHSAVEQYLRENPTAAVRVAAYQAQRQAIRSAFAARAADAMPASLSLARIIAQRNRRQPTGWLFAASVVLAIGVGFAGGWLLRSAAVPNLTQQAMAVLEQEALTKSRRLCR